VSADDAVIRASHVGKRFRLGTTVAGHYRTLREALTSWARPGSGDGTDDAATHWALRDVSFDVRAGEVVGVIGHNGAGKSTLMRILSRITEPTEGRVEIRGRVGSLLDVGTGFHVELSGRENIFLNGAILGMRRSEIARKFDEIVAFAGTEAFLDTPVKYYSSGMYMRLAFAVAAHLETDTLIVDEVLAVGDAEFQRKCLGKMGDVARDGRTVLFVSHNLGALRSLCTRALVLAQGMVGYDGKSDDAIAYYLAHAAPRGEQEGQVVFPSPGLSFGALVMHSVRLLDDSGGCRSLFDSVDRIRVEVEYEMKGPLRGLRMVLLVSTQEGEVAFQSTDHMTREADLPPGRYRTTCAIPGALLNCRMYVVELSFEIPWLREVAPRRPYVTFTISGGGNHGSTYPERWPGVVCPTLEWSTASVGSRAIR
jgi:lipopolysaccharide transport system ATP-binding protein